MLKSNIEAEKERDVIFTFIVRDGVSTAFSTKLTGAQIEKIESSVESIVDELNAGD